MLTTLRRGQADATGNLVSELRYKPCPCRVLREGELRYSNGTTPTKYTYTGQYSNVGDFGLMYYNARWFDPVLGRMAQADAIVPNPADPQSWDRYAYANNNPVKYTDPSGHFVVEDDTCTQLSCAGDPAHETNRTRDNEPRLRVPLLNTGVTRAELLFSIGAPTLPPGYVGPLPDEIILRLIQLGASPDLIRSIQIRIALEGCAPNCTYAAMTWFNEIYFFDVTYYGQSAPSEYLVHELIHVRQFRQGGWRFAIEYQAERAQAWIMGWDIYEAIPSERAASRCQGFFSGNPLQRLDTPECDLR
jgi:RHS repeat-associated protein